ncbi:MAG TPA: fused MFS/spermidine synthase, partial [Gemmatimonadaceae bacterium]
FVNAALLFTVEPMFTKLVLPFLGGAPSVWNTCLVFFQAALLVGYCYAHISTRLLNARRQMLLHLLLLGLSCLALPLQLRLHGDPPPGPASILWLLALLGVSLGVPFVMLSSGALIAQRWFAESGHDNADNPYFLYAASNLGSLIALLSYPFLVEPRLTLSDQRFAWSAGYVMLVLIVAGSSWLLARGGSRQSPAAPPPAEEISATAITHRDRALWVLYSAVPSSLLLGVTNYISTDIAAVPLLWVIPLALYLLTFVLVFAGRQLLPHPWMVRLEPSVLIAAAITIFWDAILPLAYGILLHLLVLFAVAMVCHGELARRRPPAARLTEFFVWISIGGLIGGVFTALIAPVVFNAIYEYPIMLALAGILRPSGQAGSKLQLADFLLPCGLGAALVLMTSNTSGARSVFSVIVTLVFAAILFSFNNRPLRFGLGLAAVFLAGFLRASVAKGSPVVMHAERSFFGVYQVTREAGSNEVTLYHGTTLHGAQAIIPARRLIPITYYHRNGPVGDVFEKTPAGMGNGRSVAIVGLGTGTLACYGRSGEQWTFYEIDPAVVGIATNPRYFTFVRDCPPAVRIILGDARLTMRRARPNDYDIIVLDAFSSDAIPVHLLTREAMSGYFAILKPDGVVAVHISNRHVDLSPVLAAVAKDIGLVARVRRDGNIPLKEILAGRAESDWVILARSMADLGAVANDPRWVPLPQRADVAAWTDDFSNVFRVFHWR